MGVSVIGVSIGFLEVDWLLITASKHFLNNQFKVAAEVGHLRAEVSVKVTYDSNCSYPTNRAHERSLTWQVALARKLF